MFPTEQSSASQSVQEQSSAPQSPQQYLQAYFINLDERTDRLAHLKAQLNFDFISLNRVSAVKANPPELGCALSHLKTLDLARSWLHKHPTHHYVAVFEDDFQTELPEEELQAAYQLAQQSQAPMVLWSYHLPTVKFAEQGSASPPFVGPHALRLLPVTKAHTTAGYLVHRDYLDTLATNYQEAIHRLQAVAAQPGYTKDQLGPYCIDQYWTRAISAAPWLALVPRAGGQLASYSDIVGQPQNYGTNMFMVILSCQQAKYIAARARQRPTIQRTPFAYRYFVGSSSSQEDYVETDDLVVCPCLDYYEHLPQKLQLALTYARMRYPQYDLIFKTDEDVRIYPQPLQQLYTQLTLHATGLEYGGHLVPVQPHRSVYHYGKCYDTAREVPFPVTATYCAGGGYFLRNRAIEALISADSSNALFEDAWVGQALRAAGIQPHNLPIKDVVCGWHYTPGLPAQST
jgi:hypothetical protein